MSSHTVTVAGYAAFVVDGVLLQLLSRRESSRVPSFGEALTRAMHTRTGRVGIVAAWAWFGMHLFVR